MLRMLINQRKLRKINNKKNIIKNPKIVHSHFRLGNRRKRRKKNQKRKLELSYQDKKQRLKQMKRMYLRRKKKTIQKETKKK